MLFFKLGSLDISGNIVLTYSEVMGVSGASLGVTSTYLLISLVVLAVLGTGISFTREGAPGGMRKAALLVLKNRLIASEIYQGLRVEGKAVE